VGGGCQKEPTGIAKYLSAAREMRSEAGFLLARARVITARLLFLYRRKKIVLCSAV
jgi:hypothetical protein